ncbi:MAG: cation:proton antiporter [Planctomycetaceae bacterium]
MPELHIAATLGILLAVCLTVGLIAEALRLPKVTAYLAVGVTFGPSVLDFVPHHQVLQLNPLLKLAMGLVLFQLGSQFPLPRLKPLLHRLLPISLGELTFTFGLVAVGVWAVTSDLRFGLLLGALALATAPATTLLVLQESESEGPVTDLAGGMVAINNFCSIVAFEVIFLVSAFFVGNMNSSIGMECLLLLRDIGGSLLLGAIVGIAVSYICGLLKPSRWLVLLVSANALTLGLCESLQIPYMLAFFCMGLVVVNTSTQNREIQAELKHLAGLLTVTFFVIHGAELRLEALLQVGLVGAVYVAMRSLGKYLGTRTAAKFAGESQDVCSWLGPSLLAQAGAAIALSAIAVERNPELGRQLQTVILGTVVVFELVGPVLTRYAIRQAGEMPIDQAIHHTSVTPWQQLKEVWSKLYGIGERGFQSSIQKQDVTVKQLMRPHVTPIEQSATFDKVLEFVEHSHDNTYPVVDEAGRLIGVIRYRELGQVLFDPSANTLIRAVDMADPARVVLSPENTIEDVRKSFQQSLDDCLPVVSPDHELLGIVRRRDFTKLVARQISE